MGAEDFTAAAAAAGVGGRAMDEESKVSGAVPDEKEVVVVDSAPAVVSSHQDNTPLPRVSHLQAPAVPVLQVVSRAAPIPGDVAAAVPPPPQVVHAVSLNSRKYTDRIWFVIFVLHQIAAVAAVCFFIYKAVAALVDPHVHRARNERRLLRYWLVPVEGAAVLSILLAFAWQKAVRAWPRFMIPFILWSSFLITLAAGVMLLCFSMPATAGLGAVLILFSVCAGLYACWVTRRVPFTVTVFSRAMLPLSKFEGLNGPAVLMMVVGFVWTTIWCLGVIGAASEFPYPALTVAALALSLAWTAEVMRNVTNLTVSRVVALYYLRGMQCNIQFSFQRAVSFNFGSACLASLFVPTIEALRILARGLNLLEGEDEFMFSCAHCCLGVMEHIFRYGNGWAFVHIAAYGKAFVPGSQSTWQMFERMGMEELVDSDITSSVCFLTGVASGALCAIVAGAWAFATHREYAATAALLSLFIGYLATRIGMALPQACVACYYVCFAENPESRLFDATVKDRLELVRSRQDVRVPTPRFPHHHSFPT